MGRVTGSTARVLRGVRATAKPIKAISSKVGSFADQVSEDVIEQDRAAEKRKQARKNMSEIVKVVASIQPQSKTQAPF